jgi:hypothetical protein
MLQIVSAQIEHVIYYPYKPKDGSSSMLGNDEFWRDTQDIAWRGDVKLIEFSGDLDWIDTRCNIMKQMGIISSDSGDQN